MFMTFLFFINLRAPERLYTNSAQGKDAHLQPPPIYHYIGNRETWNREMGEWLV